MLEDYGEAGVYSLRDDILMMLRHERMCLILLAVVTFACLAMNKLDVLIFHKKPFLPLHLYFFLCAFSAPVSMPKL